MNVWLRGHAAAEYGIRFGRPRHPLFSERNQGTNGIPVRWHYALGGRIAVRTGAKA